MDTSVTPDFLSICSYRCLFHTSYIIYRKNKRGTQNYEANSFESTLLIYSIESAQSPKIQARPTVEILLHFS